MRRPTLLAPSGKQPRHLSPRGPVGTSSPTAKKTLIYNNYINRTPIRQEKIAMSHRRGWQSQGKLYSFCACGEGRPGSPTLLRVKPSPYPLHSFQRQARSFDRSSWSSAAMAAPARSVFSRISDSQSTGVHGIDRSVAKYRRKVLGERIFETPARGLRRSYRSPLFWEAKIGIAKLCSVPAMVVAF